jgi:transglutaminase-like putative cysteine protease
VKPQVETDSAPPKGAEDPRSSISTARGPVKKTPYPLVHVPTPGSERVPIDAPRQRREGDALQIEVIDEAELPDGAPLFPDPATAPLALQPALVATATLPAAHPELQEQAARVVEGAADRKAAARALLDWVYKNVDKEPSVGVPNGLEVLRRMRGDCNEHTALYVALARAAGLPA